MSLFLGVEETVSRLALNGSARMGRSLIMIGRTRASFLSAGGGEVGRGGKVPSQVRTKESRRCLRGEPGGGSGG